MRTRHALAFALVSTLALVSSVGYAADTLADTPVKQSNAAQVTLVGSGKDRGRIDGDMRLRYPGFEQTAVVSSKGHIVLITMEAVQERNRGPVQCSCSSYQLRADGPPLQVASLVRLTENNNGDRTCNHPAADTDENGNIVWMFGSDHGDSNHPNTYAGIVNEKCEQLAAPIMVNATQADGTDRNSNDGAAAIRYLGNGKFFAAYYSDGGTITGPFPAPGGDYSVAMQLSLVGGVLPTLTRDWVKPAIEGGTIMRPTIAEVDATHGIVCAPQGGDRPPERVQCALVDTTTGNVITKNAFFDGRAGGMRKYYNQPSIVKVAENQFALLAIESNGMGKGTNIQGANTVHMRIIERNGDTLIPGGEIVGTAAHQKHAGLCTGGYGEQGAPALSVFSAPPTGIGRASMAMVQYDAPTKAFRFDEKADMWPISWYGDSGHLSNWYGRNPMRQGRDFLRCIGNVANPGYHQANGYMADVKTFFVGAVSGRVPGEEKNSLFLSLVPGTMDKKPIPGNPLVAGEVPEGETDPSANNNPKSDSGCGCVTVGTRSSSNGAALLGVSLALGLAISRRRRNG
jgi:hypothetical protein